MDGAKDTAGAGVMPVQVKSTTREDVSGGTARFMALVQCAAGNDIANRRMPERLLDKGWGPFLDEGIGGALAWGATNVMLHMPYGGDESFMEIDAYDECIKRGAGTLWHLATTLPTFLGEWRPKITGEAFVYLGSLLGDGEINGLIAGGKPGAAMLRVVRGFADIIDAGWTPVIDQGGIVKPATWQASIIALLARLGEVAVEPMLRAAWPDEWCAGPSVVVVNGLKAVVVHEHYFRDPRKSAADAETHAMHGISIWRKIHREEAARRNEPWTPGACLRYTREVLADERGHGVIAPVGLLIEAGCKSVSDLAPGAVS